MAVYPVENALKPVNASELTNIFLSYIIFNIFSNGVFGLKQRYGLDILQKQQNFI